jgi:hypothetical protein
MLALIDESGDAGFKLDKGSSIYFVICMAIFRDFCEAERVSKIIDNVRKNSHHTGEFRFSKVSPKVKDAFFNAIRETEFCVRALVVNKKLITAPFLKQDHDAFYNYFLRKLLERDNGILRDAHVKIDGKGERKYREELSKYLNKQLPDGKIKKLRFVNSSGDNLIQLVDMITGAIARSYKRKGQKDASRWKDGLGNKINDIWDFE